MMPLPAEPEVFELVVGKLRELTADMDVGQLSAETSVKALGLRSIVVVNAIAEIQDHYQLQNELFQRLLASGLLLDEQTIGDLVRYVMEAAAILEG
jgi:acyl carrier protein